MPGRTLKWSTAIHDAQTIAASGQNAHPLLGNLSGTRKGATITRMLINITLGAAAVDILARLKWGVVIVNNDAALASAFPDADDSADDADWLMRDAAVVVMSDVSDGSQLVRMKYDLRAQRIIRSDQDDLRFVIDRDSPVVTTNYNLFTRVLVRLP